MTNLLQRAINCDDADRAARIIRDALGIESDDVVNYCFSKEWPADHEQRARYHRRVADNRGALSGLTGSSLHAVRCRGVSSRPHLCVSRLCRCPLDAARLAGGGMVVCQLFPAAMGAALGLGMIARRFRPRAIDSIAILLCIYQFVGGRVAAGFVAAEGWAAGTRVSALKMIGRPSPPEPMTTIFVLGDCASRRVASMPRQRR
jgi:hypothetical protein